MVALPRVAFPVAPRFSSGMRKTAIRAVRIGETRLDGLALLPMKRTTMMRERFEWK